MEHFLGQAGMSGAVSDVFPQEALDMMAEYRWPGNVRELLELLGGRHCHGEVPELERGPIPDEPVAPSSAGLAGFPSVPLSELVERTYKGARSLVLDEFERIYLTKLLERSSDNVSSAARMADIDRTYLNEMLKRHGLR